MPKTYIQGLSSDLKQVFLVKNNLLTSVHNDGDNTDARDDTNNYNRVIGIALLKAFSCAKKVTSKRFITIQKNDEKVQYYKSFRKFKLYCVRFTVNTICSFKVILRN